MAYVLNVLGYYASINELGAYFIVFLGANIWGDLTAIAGSILAFHGYLDWIPLITSAFLGVFLGDNIVYRIGKLLRDSEWGAWIEARLPYRDKIEDYLHKNSLEALTLSKFIMGFNVPVLFMSGYCGAPYRTFVKSAFLAAVIWTAVIFPIGYLTATAVYGIGALGYKRMEFGVLIAIAVVFLFRLVRHKFGARIETRRDVARPAAIDEPKETR